PEDHALSGLEIEIAQKPCLQLLGDRLHVGVGQQALFIVHQVLRSAPSADLLEGRRVTPSATRHGASGLSSRETPLGWVTFPSRLAHGNTQTMQSALASLRVDRLMVSDIAAQWRGLRTGAGTRFAVVDDLLPAEWAHRLHQAFLASPEFFSSRQSFRERK